MRTNGNDKKSTLRINIDQQKTEHLGQPLTEINTMLSVVFSGKGVNDFVLGSNLRPVIAQGATDYRMQPDDTDSWFARNNLGEMVPFPSFITTGIDSCYVIVRSLVARLRGRKTSSRVRSILRYPENCAKNKELAANPAQCADTPHIRYKLGP